MADYITLMGAEDVRAAGRSISSAADDMRNAAGTIDSAMRDHRIALSDFLFEFNQSIDRLEAVLKKGKENE